MTKPLFPLDLLAQAVDHHRAGRLGEAARLYNQTLQIDPSNHQALGLLATLAHQTGAIDQAIDLFTRALECAPKNPKHPAAKAALHNNLGALLLEKEQPHKAQEAFQQAIALKPDYHEALVNLAMAHHALNETEPAIENLKRAIDIQPDAPLPHRLLEMWESERPKH